MRACASRPLFGMAILLGVAISAPGCTGDKNKRSLREALEAGSEEKLPEGYKPNPKPRPKGLPGPTESEFKAWDRKDPEGEKHLYKFDKKNLDRMLDYFEQLQCYRDHVKEEGAKAFGVEPGSPEEEQWYQFKQLYVPRCDQWQKHLFSIEPRILEKSKFIGHILEAHEAVMNNYPKAYNNGDKLELEKADIHWEVVENKIGKYVKQLTGKDWERRDRTTEKYAEYCEKALQPPEDKGKRRKVKGKGKGKKKVVEL